MTQRQMNKIFTEIGALRLEIRLSRQATRLAVARTETLLNKLERETNAK